MNRAHQHVPTCYWDVFNARWHCEASAATQQPELPEQREAAAGDEVLAG